MEWFIAILAIGLIIGLFAASADEKETKARKDMLEAKISKLPNAEGFKKVFGQKNQYAFILDNVGSMV